MSIAIAGGTGGLGRALVEGILAKGKRKVVVLTRKVSGSPDANSNVRFVAVDYSNVDSLVLVLEEHNVDTVISTVNNITGENQSELNLIEAAERSKTTNRFVPSYFGIPYLPEQYEAFPPAIAKKTALEALKKTSLEWTTVYNGFFLDYFGTPRVKSYMDDVAFFVDLANNVASIPGSGNVPIVFTHTSDVARFIAEFLEHPNWRPESYIIGDRVTFNEVVRMAEDVKGTKFTVFYNSVESLKANVMVELPAHHEVYKMYPKEMLHSFLVPFGLECERGQANFKPAHTLNDDFPHIKPVSAREILERGWGNV
ncbi:Putative NmrA-like domain, NAD(P)-binding domain superfamily [Colletotrichum destructivum]|uniref:NmrA-like domain, NAD(P)-binding domain superfamily n=1 Tax=Colletotrichum destructivum TaxID=34406 RepID=A0AAX4I6B2_9PEZI|nr:Putative NmrA-like domain, NAD(P)-binding domain superfamily [Colletotrichum destructivum]